MAGRYDSHAPKLDFGSASSFGSEPAPKKKDDPLADFLRFAGGLAPAAGTALGAVGGGLAGGLLGVPGGPLAGLTAAGGAGLGAGIGGALGTAAGGAANFGADKLDEPQLQAENERLNREQERQARMQAALSMFGNI